MNVEIFGENYNKNSKDISSEGFGQEWNRIEQLSVLMMSI